jgi:hypothetical protein
MSRYTTINVNKADGEHISRVAAACGMLRGKLATMAIAEWVERHCGPDTTAGKKLAELKQKSVGLVDTK